MKHAIGESIGKNVCTCAGRFLPPPPVDTTLFVARDLDHWVTDAEQQFGLEVEIDGKKFQRLTPRVFRWLRQQVAKAEQLCAEGKLSQEQHAQIVMAFVPVYEFAKKQGIVSGKSSPSTNPCY